MEVSKILRAMRADAIPAGTLGRWSVTKETITPEQEAAQVRIRKRQIRWRGFASAPFVEAGEYTCLHCTTPPLDGRELVMNDFYPELSKHLTFIRAARGNVLVTGLGLGCVVRGLMAAGKCSTITVVEREKDVIELCGASIRHERVAIVHSDARDFVDLVKRRYKTFFDCAWHDLWVDPVRPEGTKSLPTVHIELMTKLASYVSWQGAWALPRYIKRLMGDGVIK